MSQGMQAALELKIARNKSLPRDPRKKAALLTHFRLLTSRTVRISLCCFKPYVFGNLLQQQEETGTGTEGLTSLEMFEI